MFITFIKIYDKESLVIIEQNIRNIKFYYVLICIGMIALYFLCQSIYMKYILNSLNVKISLIKGVFYSMVEFFYSGITPSSTGGQPVQLYYMTKDNIPIRKSYITLILNTIYFKLVLVILGIIVLIFNNSYILHSDFIYQLFFVLGFVVDVALVIFGFLLLFRKSLIKNLYGKLFKILNKFKIFKKLLVNMEPDTVMAKYNDEIIYIKTHTKTVFVTFIITFIQRLLLFSIIYVIYRALGFNEYSYCNLLAIQVSVQLAIEVLPLPGGAGLSEGMLHSIFVTLFASKLADVGMLLTRTFTFYVPLMVSGLVIFIEYLYRKHKLRRLRIKGGYSE